MTLTSQIVGTRENSEGLEGFVDKNGNYIVPPVFYIASWNEEEQLGKAAYSENDFIECGLIFDPKGSQIFPTGYASVYVDDDTGLLNLSESQFRVIDERMLTGERIPLKEGESVCYRSGKPYIVTHSYGVGDRAGNIIIPCKYSNCYFSKKYNAYYVERQTESGNFRGIIDKNGNVQVPCEFIDIDLAAEDVYIVENAYNKFGYYSNGIEIIPCIYDRVTAFANDVARVTKDGAVSLISNPLKDSEYKIYVTNNKQKKDKTKVYSRYPEGNSEVDKEIPQSTERFENKFAIIIANENYGISPAPYSLNDGRTFKEYCIKSLGIPKENTYIYEDATYGNMISAIELIKNLSDAFDGELDLIIYYAGHGVPDEDNKSAYLLPIDGSIIDIEHTGISLKWFYTQLSKLKMNKAIIFLDACFSGAKRDDEMLLSGRGVTIKVNEEVPPVNMIVFSASTGNETAHQLTEKNHGLFTYYLLKTIQDNSGNVTLGDLSDSVTKNVKRQSVVINSKKQTPTVIPSNNMIGNWRSLKL